MRRTNNASATTNSHAVYRLLAGASEPASYLWTFSSSVGSAGGIQAFSGVNTSTPIDVELGQSNASSLTQSAPSVTPATTRTMIVTSHSFASAATWTPPAGMTEAFDVASQAVPSAAGVSIEGDFVLQPLAAATGIKSATASANADVGNTQIIALRHVP